MTLLTPHMSWESGCLYRKYTATAAPHFPPWSSVSFIIGWGRKIGQEYIYNYHLFEWLQLNLLLSITQEHYLIIRKASVQFSCSVVSNSLQPHGLQHTRPPCPSPTPRVHSNPCPLSRWFHPTISSSVVPFSSYLQSFPASGSFQMSQFFASGGQSIEFQL